MKSVLFVCIGNACRSQMAEGWLRHLAQEVGRNDIQVFSAGSSPLGSIPEETTAVMLEAEIDISKQWSKPVDELPQEEFDYVISLCGDRCPYVPAEEHIDWKIDDPIGEPIESYRRTRDVLKERIINLLNEI